MPPSLPHGVPPYVPPVDPDAFAGPEDDGPSSPPPEHRRYRRRREDRTPPTVVSIVGSLVDNKLVTLAAAALAFLGGRVTGPGERMTAIERAQDLDRQRDSISIADRRELREVLATALTLIGRAECKKLTAPEASDLGIPCAEIRAGQIWPLFRRLRDIPPPLPAAPAAPFTADVSGFSLRRPSPQVSGGVPGVPVPPPVLPFVLTPVAPVRAWGAEPMPDARETFGAA